MLFFLPLACIVLSRGSRTSAYAGHSVQAPADALPSNAHTADDLIPGGSGSDKGDAANQSQSAPKGRFEAELRGRSGGVNIATVDVTAVESWAGFTLGKHKYALAKLPPVGSIPAWPTFSPTILSALFAADLVDFRAGRVSKVEDGARPHRVLLTDKVRKHAVYLASSAVHWAMMRSPEAVVAMLTVFDMRVLAILGVDTPSNYNRVAVALGTLFDAVARSKEPRFFPVAKAIDDLRPGELPLDEDDFPAESLALLLASRITAFLAVAFPESLNHLNSHPTTELDGPHADHCKALIARVLRPTSPSSPTHARRDSAIRLRCMPLEEASNLASETTVLLPAAKRAFLAEHLLLTTPAQLYHDRVVCSGGDHRLVSVAHPHVVQLSRSHAAHVKHVAPSNAFRPAAPLVRAATDTVLAMLSVLPDAKPDKVPILALTWTSTLVQAASSQSGIRSARKNLARLVPELRRTYGQADFQRLPYACEGCAAVALFLAASTRALRVALGNSTATMFVPPCHRVNSTARIHRPYPFPLSHVRFDRSSNDSSPSPAPRQQSNSSSSSIEEATHNYVIDLRDSKRSIAKLTARAAESRPGALAKPFFSVRMAHAIDDGGPSRHWLSSFWSEVVAMPSCVVPLAGDAEHHTFAWMQQPSTGRLLGAVMSRTVHAGLRLPFALDPAFLSLVASIGHQTVRGERVQRITVLDDMPTEFAPLSSEQARAIDAYFDTAFAGQVAELRGRFLFGLWGPEVYASSAEDLVVPHPSMVAFSVFGGMHTNLHSSPVESVRTAMDSIPANETESPERPPKRRKHRRQDALSYLTKRRRGQSSARPAKRRRSVWPPSFEDLPSIADRIIETARDAFRAFVQETAFGLSLGLRIETLAALVSFSTDMAAIVNCSNDDDHQPAEASLAALFRRTLARPGGALGALLLPRDTNALAAIKRALVFEGLDAHTLIPSLVQIHFLPASQVVTSIIESLEPAQLAKLMRAWTGAPSLASSGTYELTIRISRDVGVLMADEDLSTPVFFIDSPLENEYRALVRRAADAQAAALGVTAFADPFDAATAHDGPIARRTVWVSSCSATMFLAPSSAGRLLHALFVVMQLPSDIFIDTP